jgi:hypothetical protein
VPSPGHSTIFFLKNNILPSAKPCALGTNYFFFKNQYFAECQALATRQIFFKKNHNFAECHGQALGKIVFIFWEKIFCRVPWAGTRQKKILDF